MDARYAAVIVATIVIGLNIDAHGGSWGQPVVNVAAWIVFGGLLARSSREDRIGYLLCLVLATAGEVFLALVWGVYDYRLGNLPLFVPPGHVLLYALGKWIADRISFTATGLACAVVLALAATLATLGIDRLSAPLAVLFVLCMRHGPAPRLYAVMFVLALAMEILGTGLGNWTWREQAPWVGWSTLNPPFAAGAFYCALDLLVGRLMQRKHPGAALTARMR